MRSTARRQRSSPDIWPGFVDAMAGMLIIIIFVLLVFTLAQHFLGEILSGRNAALDRLNREVAELADMLALERDSGAALRRELSLTSTELQTSIAARDQMASQLALLLPERDALETALSENVAANDRLVSERDALDAALAASVAENNRLLAELTLRDDERDRLNTALAAARDEAGQERDRLNAALAAMRDEAGQERDRLNATLAAMRAKAATVSRALEDANKVVAADREKIELQLRVLESLRRDIAALGKVRTELERKVIDLASALETRVRELTAARDRGDELKVELTTARDRSDELEAELTAGSDRARTLQASLTTARDRSDELEAELTVGSDRAKTLQASLTTARDRTKVLEARLTAARDRNRVLEAELTAAGKRNRALDTRLTAVRDRAMELEAKLSTEQERTALSQRSLSERDVRLAELAGRARKAAVELGAEKKLSAAARARVALLSRQIAALRQTLARLATALEASEAESRARNVTIVNLGSRLNAALASKVAELSRYRSEFFGKLREVLGDHKNIRIVGDRFVFQSEVLFQSGSAELADIGRRQIERLAATLKDIAKRIPDDVDWVLRVDGHTDRIPIRTARFPSNWELSTGRAISVVKHLIEAGIPANRLAATGFGEFQPIDPGSDQNAYRRNRRIELKLTGR